MEKQITDNSRLGTSLLLFSATARMALCQDNSEYQQQNGDNLNDDVVARAAQIVGVDRQSLINAVNQARSETKERDLRNSNPYDRWLGKMVQEGRISKELAERFKAWWASKPVNPQDNPQQFKEWLDQYPETRAAKTI